LLKVVLQKSAGEFIFVAVLYKLQSLTQSPPEKLSNNQELCNSANTSYAFLINASGTSLPTTEFLCLSCAPRVFAAAANVSNRARVSMFTPREMMRAARIKIFLSSAAAHHHRHVAPHPARRKLCESARIELGWQQRSTRVANSQLLLAARAN